MSYPAIHIGLRLQRHLRSDPETGCLVWSGLRSAKGYGKITAGGARSRKRFTHRVAYELAKGPIPAGLEIDHLCRNRACCNPDHLEAVTREENIRRGDAPHMVNTRKTHCKRGHEFTPENTLFKAKPDRKPSRQCRVCTRAAARAAYARKVAR